MSKIISSFQEEENLKETKSTSYSLAVVGNKYNDGLSLIFPGSDTESQKHYKYNTAYNFQSNQRVYIVKTSGTYIVICPIGP